MTAIKIQPVAEICSASHDDAQFGERAIKPLCDISGFEYGTPLYAGAAPAAVSPRGDEDDSLLLCASDLQHSAIYDSHSEMQDCARSVADRIKALAAPALEAPAAPAAPWCPDVCPITGRPFFMWIDHWQTGKPVPTYGGPYDSYTIPVKDSDGSFECERYDHDEGGWLTEGAGWHCLGVKLVNDQSFVVDPSNPRYNEIEAFAAAAPQAPAEVVGWVHPQWAAEQGRGRIYGHNPGGYIAVQIAAPQAPAAPSAEGLREQHYRDSAELRRLCQARDEARRERDLARAEIAGLQTSTGHLSALVDGQHALLEKAKATMTALHGAASPIDESGGDFDARIPASAFARFVDAHAELLHAMAQSPVAAPAAPAVDAFTHAELLEIQRAVEEFADCNETDVDYDLLMRAAQAGYLECTQFHVLNQSALDLDTVAAAQAKEGGAA